MGASAVAGIANAKDTTRTTSSVGTQTDCEALYAQPVVFPASSQTPPTDAAGAQAKLWEVIVFGFQYEYDGSSGSLPEFKLVFEKHLNDAYGEDIGSALGLKWPMSVCQAFILGQLTRYFWTKSQKNASEKDKNLRFKHLASAWAVFGRATSSVGCADWVKHKDLKNKGAYVLPLLLNSAKPSSRGEEKILQINQACALCG